MATSTAINWICKSISLYIFGGIFKYNYWSLNYETKLTVQGVNNMKIFI